MNPSTLSYKYILERANLLYEITGDFLQSIPKYATRQFLLLFLFSFFLGPEKIWLLHSCNAEIFYPFHGNQTEGCKSCVYVAIFFFPVYYIVDLRF